jgi:hypothetical protein
MTTSMPSTPVSRARLASSRWQRMWVSTLHRSPSRAMARQSSKLFGEAEGLVSSIYSTPNSSRARAMRILSSVEKWAPTNCSPSRRVDSMM